MVYTASALVIDNGELKTSDVLYTTMAGISFTDVGSVVAGVFFMADLATYALLRVPACSNFTLAFPSLYSM